MAHRHLLRALCAAAIFSAPFTTCGTEAATAVPSPSAPPEITHVVTADRSDETLHNATRSTYVVGHDEIIRRGYRTIGDAIASLPGVEITRYGPIGQNVSYGIRGSSSAQVLVLVDGMPAPGAFANSVQLGTASTVGVRRIEVVEGGGSTLYGTGAIGGIINIITDAQFAQPSAMLRYGAFNDREIQLQSHGLSYERVVANNAFALPDSPGNPSTRDNGDDETTSLGYGLDATIGKVAAALRTRFESDHLGVAGVFPYFSPTSRENDVNTGMSAAFTLDGARASTTLQLGGSRQQLAFACNAADDANCYFAVPALSTESRTDMNLRTTLRGAAMRTIFGIDLSRGSLREDSGAGVEGSIATASFAQSAAYVQTTRSTGNSNVYAGLRAERDGSLGGEFSPSLGFSAPFANGVELKVNAATAFRAPNASELYFPGYGNPLLHPERAQVGDITLADHRILGGISAAWFTNQTNDLIVEQYVGLDSSKNPIYRLENVNHARMAGLTLDAQTLPLHGVTAGLALTDLYRAQNIDDGSRLPNDPIFTVSLNLAFHGAASSFFDDGGISARAVGERSAIDFSQPLFSQATAYSNLDAYARFRLAPRWLLALRGYNLGNERYAEVAGFPMPGRTFALEIATK